MSATLDELLIRKVGDSSWTSLVTASGVRLESCPMLMPTTVKDPYTTDFNDENGIVSYDAGTQKFKEFDATFKFVVVTTSPTDSHGIIKYILDYLTSDGNLHEIYSAWAGVGRTKCRFKSLGDFSQHMNKDNEFVVQFSLTFCIEDPVTEIEE